MSSIRQALEKLDRAIDRLDVSVALPDVPASLQVGGRSALYDRNGNIIDVDFVAARLDRAIQTVEQILRDGE